MNLIVIDGSRTIVWLEAFIQNVLPSRNDALVISYSGKEQTEIQ